MFLQVISPSKTIFEGEVLSVKVPGEEKLMTIDQLPDYAKFKLDECEMLTNYLFIPMASLI